MRDDVPAAFPLIAFVFGLACALSLVNPNLTLAGLGAVAALCLLLRWQRESTVAIRAAAAILFAALGIIVATRAATRATDEARAFAPLASDRFVIIEAPLGADWSPRGNAQMLRVQGFTATQEGNAARSADVCLIYGRFVPPPIGMESSVRVEGFLRRNERGFWTLSVKSPLLVTYHGRLSPWSPAAWNRYLANRLRPHARSHPVEVALVEALVLGRGEQLSDDVRENFRRGGTYHLLVFSGLQIALAAAVIAALLRWMHAPRVSDWSLLAFAILAPLFIGATASVSRASIAIGLYALSRIARRPTSYENLWCVAALVRLLIAPHDLADPGFHLTFAGAGALFFVGKHLVKRRWIGQVVAAEVVMTPLTLFHFHQYALAGSLLTIALTPPIFAMLLTAIAACALPCNGIFAVMALLHRVCIFVNDAGAFGSGFFAAPPLQTLLIGFGASMLAIATLRRRTRSIAILAALAIPLIGAALRKDHIENARMTMLDVGQGDAILLRDAAHSVLVDGGGRLDDARFGESRLLPLLVDRGVRTLDAVVLTHAHPDHCGGLPAVLRHLRVRELWISPRRFRGDCAHQLLAAAGDTTIRILRDRERHTFGAMHIEVLLQDRTFRKASENNASVALRVHAARRRILLTGDLEAMGESDLADRDVRADVLKVAHHGSRTSTTRLLLDAVRPRVALISCGRDNLYGHPHPRVLDDLEDADVRTWRTDTGGSIDVDLVAGHLRVRREIDTLP